MTMEILLFSREEMGNGDHEQINQMFEMGLNIFHLRLPQLNRVRYESVLKGIKPEFRKRVVIHSHLGLIRKYQIGGIHLTERIKKYPLRMNRLIEKVHSIQGKLRISISCHSLKELVTLNKIFAYATLSPIFDSISKEGYRSQFDLKAVKDSISKTETKVVALGGCDATKLKTIENIGFWGVGLLGAIWNKPDPVLAFQQFTSKIKEECNE